MRTHVGTVMAAKSERRYEVVRLADEAVLARALTIWGFVDVRSARPMRIPDEVYDAFGFERRKKRALSD